jgi:integrase
MGRYQRGYIYEAFGAFHIRYYVTELADGKPVRKQRSTRLCAKDNRHHSTKCRPVQTIAAQVMQQVNALSGNAPEADTRIADFWEETYLPHLERTKKASTLHGYRKIWEHHLNAAFAGLTLREYQPYQATTFLTTLAERNLGKRTIAHIRSVASGLFRHALRLDLISANPWHDAGSLVPIKESQGTYAYSLEEAEAIVNALIETPPAQLVFALAAFCGLRPSEISGLKWEDIDIKWIHIRRSSWRGHVGTTKTPENVSSIPLIEPIRSMLAVWRGHVGNPLEGWVFPNRRGEPMEMSGFGKRVIAPILKARGIVWKGLYAGRRAAGTLLTQLTGDALAASYVLRHKNLSTTTAFYVKPVRAAALEGMKALEEALAGRKALVSANGSDEHR